MWQVEIKNRMSEIPAVNERIEEWSTRCDWPMECAYAVTLAVEELVTNIIKYGYDDPDEHRIVIRIGDAPGDITLEIEDDGHEFNPILGPPPAFDRPLEDRPIGGLGLHLIKELSKKMDYTRQNNRNKVTLLFSKQPHPEQGASS